MGKEKCSPPEESLNFMYHQRVQLLQAALSVFTHGFGMPLLFSFSFQKLEFASVQLSVKRFRSWGSWLSLFEHGTAKFFWQLSCGTDSSWTSCCLVAEGKSKIVFWNSLIFQVETVSSHVCLHVKMDFGSCQVRAKAANTQTKKNMIVELPSLRPFLNDAQQNQRAVSVLLRWGEEDHHHHRLLLHICSVDLWDYSAKELNVVDAFLGLACICGARAHLESSYHDYYVLKCCDTIILIFRVCLSPSGCVYLFLFPFSLCYLIFLLAVWLLSPLPVTLPVFPGHSSPCPQQWFHWGGKCR